jgi:hypothetical protein
MMKVQCKYCLGCRYSKEDDKSADYRSPLKALDSAEVTNRTTIQKNKSNSTYADNVIHVASGEAGTVDIAIPSERKVSVPEVSLENSPGCKGTQYYPIHLFDSTAELSDAAEMIEN